MTRVDLDAHGCRLADFFHAGEHERAYEFAVGMAAGSPEVACYLGARVFDRLRFMGAPMDAQEWLDLLESKAVKATEGKGANEHD